MAVRDAFQRQSGGVGADLVAGLVDAGQRDGAEGGEGGVVVAGDGDVVGGGQAGFGEGFEHADRDDVGAGEDGCRAVGAGEGLAGAAVAIDGIINGFAGGLKG